MAAKKKVIAKKKAKKKVAKKKTDNRTRVDKIKDAHREELRKKFKGNEYIRQLEQAAKDYDSVHKKLKQRGIMATVQREVLKLQIDVIKAKVDLNLKRLRFVIPELKAISFENGDGQSLTDQFFAAMSQATKDNK